MCSYGCAQDGGDGIGNVLQMCELMTIGENGQSVVHVDSECRSKGVPYCDSFVVCNHYCATSLAPKQTRLIVYSEINYTKSVWGVAKGRFLLVL